ncbi:energy-coupling factor transporter ATPase [Shimazuella sp. AN120528]|uniref:energy-coupling factor transporter ATPase n=1 Tax=Shimazuella soli TaxID=1892854 RepID=UPI001F1021CD|nr:energy-coupling factor transporter ATPase [Shimazuella soli]MCH5585967.1 energy-coupling factor transporter ATPase [Shimazuella soli]
MGTEITLKDVWFHYYPQTESRENWAVQNVSLDFQQGEYVSIIGSNGSGKSSLACLLNGLFIPTEGAFCINGQPITTDQDRWELKRRVGMIFQNPDNQIVAPSVVDDIAFGLENLGVSREEMKYRIPLVLEQVGLSGLEKKEPHHLSGGQKQRLAIAGILAMQPDVIIFDESTSMLDPDGRKHILRLMDELHKSGITIIHITHQATEAFLAERLIVIHQGRIMMDQSSKELYANATLLDQWGLDVPIGILLHQALRDKGWKLSEKMESEEQLVSELWTSM